MASILVIEDEPDSGDVVSRFLRRFGHHVALAVDGQDALVKLIEGQPDIIVLDLRLPKMDGLSLLEMMRDCLRWTLLPVIILSAHATEQQLTRARSMGVNYIFKKGQFDLLHLAAAIGEVTGLAHSN